MINERLILQKLRSKATSKGMPFQLVLQLFCQEEFLRRLERSEFKNKLILKGGLFLFSYSGFESRPTMDIDFLARHLSNDREEMKKVIDSINSFSDIFVITTLNLGGESQDIYELYKSIEEKRVKVSKEYK